MYGAVFFMTLHFDSGIPWSEALANEPYPAEVEKLIASLKSQLTKDQQVYLAITPIAFTRNQRASYWGDPGNAAEAASWKERRFDAPEVIAGMSGGDFFRAMSWAAHPVSAMANGFEGASRATLENQSSGSAAGLPSMYG